MSDANKWTDLAYKVLLELNDGHEPYAASVSPMARALERVFTPDVVLREAERLLRYAGASGAVLHGDGRARIVEYEKDGQLRSWHPMTTSLADAYAKLVAQKAGGT